MAIYPIRPVAEDELAGFLAVDQHASHGTPLSERAHANLLARLEFDRTLAALDGDTIIGTAGVFTADPAATAALWDNLLSQDLLSEFHARMRPVDDPLLYLLADPRRVRSVVSDGLWIRLVDVGSASTQRHYACPVDVVIEVATSCARRTRAAGGWPRRLVPLPQASAPPANGPPSRPT